jgi:hypothetical protein
MGVVVILKQVDVKEEGDGDKGGGGIFRSCPNGGTRNEINYS